MLIDAFLPLHQTIQAATEGEYRFVAKWGPPDLTRDGNVQNPTGIAVDTAGLVYVADRGNNRVQKFTSAGNLISKWGSQGSGNGQFSERVSLPASVYHPRNPQSSDYYRCVEDQFETFLQVYKVFKVLLNRGKITEEIIRMISTWKHSGFPVFCGNPISPNDETAMENLARYIIRVSFSQERMQYLNQVFHGRFQQRRRAPLSLHSQGFELNLYKALDIQTL